MKFLVWNIFLYDTFQHNHTVADERLSSVKILIQNWKELFYLLIITGLATIMLPSFSTFYEYLIF